MSGKTNLRTNLSVARLKGSMDYWVGARIRSRREILGYTQSGLSDRTGINKNRLTAIEKGRSIPSPDVLHKLSLALEVHPGWFFDGGGTAALRLHEQQEEPEELLIALQVPAFKELVTRFAGMDVVDMEHIRWVIETAHEAQTHRLSVPALLKRKAAGA